MVRASVYKPIGWDCQFMAHYQRLSQRHISMFKVLITVCVGEVEVYNSCMIISHKEIGAVTSPKFVMASYLSLDCL